LKAHEDFWKLIWKSQKARNFEFTTLTPEYGPIPYTPSLPFTNVPVSDLWEITNFEANRLRKNFYEWNPPEHSSI